MTGRPEYHADRPRRPSALVDPLSSMLRAVRLSGAVFFEIDAVDPWAAETPPGETIVDAVMPGSGHLIPYHVLTYGRCWVWPNGGAPIQLAAGDIVAFPHGDGHVVASEPGMKTVPDLDRFRAPRDRPLPFHLRMGGASGESSAHMVCGYLGCDRLPFNPLLDSLPPVIHIGDRDGGALAAAFALAREEAEHDRIGGETVLGRLSELMFVQVVRRYLETLPAEETNWLSGLRDPVVGAALTALHGDPSREWSLNLLAREVGVSRSRLAERFTQLMGESPMQYLLHWRMHLAANRLRDGSETVAAVADASGYESEVAFSRAFKKIVGMPPAQWRKEGR